MPHTDCEVTPAVRAKPKTNANRVAQCLFMISSGPDNLLSNRV